MNGKYLNNLFKIDAAHALYRDDGKWYHNLKKFPGVLFDKTGYMLFENESSYLNHPDLQIKQDLHVANGISSLKDYIKFSDVEIGIVVGENGKSSPESIIRVRREIDQLLRNQAYVTEVKTIYQYRCQLCNEQLIVGKKKYYSEVHHIKPLGQPHNGPDSLNNMINVCPNHHALLDLRAITLSQSRFTLLKHQISDEYINYHNFLVKSFSH